VTNGGKAENRRGSAAALGTKRGQFAEILSLARTVCYPAVGTKTEWGRQEDHGEAARNLVTLFAEGVGDWTFVASIPAEAEISVKKLLPLVRQSL